MKKLLTVLIVLGGLFALLYTAQVRVVVDSSDSLFGYRAVRYVEYNRFSISEGETIANEADGNLSVRFNLD